MFRPQCGQSAGQRVTFCDVNRKIVLKVGQDFREHIDSLLCENIGTRVAIVRLVEVVVTERGKPVCCV